MSRDVKETKGLTRLHGLTAAEISLVPTGANKRRFLVFKSSKKAEGHVGLAQRIREKVLKTDPAVMGKVRELIQRHNVKGQEDSVNVFGEQDGAADHSEVDHMGERPSMEGNYPEENDDSAVVKEGGDMGPTAEGADMGASAGGSLSKQAEAALQAVVRILTPFKDEVPTGLLHDVLKASGFQAPPEAEPGVTPAGDGKAAGEHFEPKEAEFQALPAKVENEEDDFLEGVTKEHMAAASDEGEKAYKQHLEKLGYQKYPMAKMGMKRGGGAADEPMEGETVSKSGSASVVPGLAQIKDPHTRRVLEQVQKSNLELVRKNADLEKQLTDQRSEARRKEIVLKAASFKFLGLPQDDLVGALADADKLGAASYERVVKSFTALNDQAQKGGLFTELGSSQGSSGGADDFDAKMWQIADGIVQKNSGSLTREQAYAKAAETVEGQRLYREYKAQRPHGI